jgi:hypothetical protein
MGEAMSSSGNPYTAPAAPIGGGLPAAEEAGPATGESAREVFLAWEKLRALYCGVLAAESLLLGIPHLGRPVFWVLLAYGAFVANLCFCVGPCAEGYLALLGIDRRAVRWALWGLGLVLAMLLTGAAVLSFSLRDFD